MVKAQFARPNTTLTVKKSSTVCDCCINLARMIELNLNIIITPIAYKYCEGNLKRIEKSKLKEYEIE